MKENFLIPKGLSIEISISDEDIDLKKASKKFLETLENEHNKFIEDLNQEKNKYEKIKDNLKKNGRNSIFYPEKLSKNSPMTIIDAPWGTGKTYFIEALANFFESDECNDTNFKKIIIIDVWKYSNSQNIPEEIMAELFYKIYKSINNKKMLKDITQILFDTTDKVWLKRFGKFFEVYNNSKNCRSDIYEKYNSNLKQINNELPKTIIFFDNIERLGSHSWEVIKAIFKLSIFNNFVFVLPMNIKKLDNNQNSNIGEYPIEKYIDIPYFELKQNYLGLLNKMNFNIENCILLNNFLNVEIEGKKLSIREAEQRIKNNNILYLSEKNKYDMLTIFIQKIWGSVEKIEECLSEDIDSFLNLLKNLSDIYNKTRSSFEKYYNYKLLKSEIDFEKDTSYDFNFSSNSVYEWDTKWKEYIVEFQKQIKKNILNNLILEKEIKKINSRIKKEQEKNHWAEQEINKLSKDLENLKKEDFRNQENIVMKETTIKNYNSDIKDNNKNIKEEKKALFEYQKAVNIYNDVDKNLNLLKEEIEENIKNFSAIKDDWLNEKHNKQLSEIIIKEIKEIKDYYNNQDSKKILVEKIMAKL